MGGSVINIDAENDTSSFDETKIRKKMGSQWQIETNLTESNNSKVNYSQTKL